MFLFLLQTFHFLLLLILEPTCTGEIDVRIQFLLRWQMKSRNFEWQSDSEYQDPADGTTPKSIALQLLLVDSNRMLFCCQFWWFQRVFFREKHTHTHFSLIDFWKWRKIMFCAEESCWSFSYWFECCVMIDRCVQYDLISASYQLNLACFCFLRAH